MKQDETKGFTLIELLVALTIIGILATVGVVTYNGYAIAAKQNVSKIIHSKTVRFLSAEVTLCSLLDDGTIMKSRISCGYQEGDWNGCDSADCKAQMIVDELDVFEDENPYDNNERAVTAIESDLGYTVVYNREDHLEIKTQWDKDETISPLINYIYFDGTTVAMTGTSGPDEPNTPTIIRTLKSARGCPTGWTLELNFCVPKPDAPTIIQTLKSARGCPTGWTLELNFCVAEPDAPTIIQTLKSARGCPTGWTLELNFCVAGPDAPTIIQTLKSARGCPTGWTKELNFCVQNET